MSDSDRIAHGQKPFDQKTLLFYKIIGASEDVTGGFLDTPFVYMDFNHDGLEDAVIQLITPGSGIFGSYIIFLQSKSDPKFSGYGGGNHFGMCATRDTLVVSTGHFLADEPNCCPRAHDIQRVVGNGDTVRFLPIEVLPSEK